MRGLPEENMFTVLRRRAEETPDRPLITVHDKAVTWREFIAQTDRIARGLRALSVRPGQKVGLILANSTQWYHIFWAAVQIGALPVPLDPQIGQWELSRLFGLTEMQHCFVNRSYRHNELLKNVLLAAERAPALKTIVLMDDDAADRPGRTDTDTRRLISFEEFLQLRAHEETSDAHPADDTTSLMLACTSGSTGNPKIIAVPHRGFHRSQKDMADYLELSPSDVMLLGMPLYHQGGFGMGLQMVLNGGSVIYQPSFDPVTFLELMERNAVTVLQLTPTLAKIILSVPDFQRYDLSCLRLAYFAGEVLPESVARVFTENLGIRVVNIVGSTETATMLVWDSRREIDTDVNRFRALPFTKMKIVDDESKEVAVGNTGRIFIHTDALLTEYYGNTEETDRCLRRISGESWFDTGDLGERSADGRVRFAGRLKRVIKRGGNLVYPEEIESFLLTHPDIAAVAVTGQTHALIGEQIVAHVQPRQGITFGRRELVQFCRGRLAAYKIPDRLVMVESLPKDIGKIQHKYLNR